MRILGLYSNVLEGSRRDLRADQNSYAKYRFGRPSDRVPDRRADKDQDREVCRAVIIAVHHPPFTGGSEHGGSPLMLADIDGACTAAGVWPHAVFSGHAHNYQRYTRTVDSIQIPYLVAGCGGHSPLSSMRATYRTPYVIDETLTLESYDDTDYGYLRIVVNATTMTIEFHPQSDGRYYQDPGRQRNHHACRLLDQLTKAISIPSFFRVRLPSL